jgi:hypothetical protein
MQKPAVQDRELKALTAFMDNIGSSREPTIRIYRLETPQKQHQTRFRKHTRVGEVLLSDFSHDPSDLFEYLRAEFGAGTFLLRTVRSNGTYGPSRVVSIARTRDF